MQVISVSRANGKPSKPSENLSNLSNRWNHSNDAGRCWVERGRSHGDVEDSSESSLNCPVLSPSVSAGTPILLSSVSCRLVRGVSSGYTRWRPPLIVPAPPPRSSVGSGPCVCRSLLLMPDP